LLAVAIQFLYNKRQLLEGNRPAPERRTRSQRLHAVRFFIILELCLFIE
jgi:hypothetical protein